MPYTSEAPKGMSDTDAEHWCRQMHLKTNMAASKLDAVAYALSQDNLIQFAGPKTYV